MSFLKNPKFDGCNIQINKNNGVQNNSKQSGLKYDDIEFICNELEVVALENDNVHDIIKKLRSKAKQGSSKKKMFSLLKALKNTIEMVSIVTKFPEIVEKVKPIIEGFIGK